MVAISARGHWIVIALLAVVVVAGIGLMAWRKAAGKGLDRWLPTYLSTCHQRRFIAEDQTVHVLLCVVDHFEPGFGSVSESVAMTRVENWVEKYPKLFGGFSDSDGRKPRHSFFYPIEMYKEAEVAGIAGLCRDGFGEVEVHLHHDNDTSDNLRRTLLDWKQLLRDRHGLLSEDKRTGEIRYGFIHGNWALDNSRPDGRWCGVNNELDILRETGCYADFTFPSFPSPTQTRKINSLYYAIDDPTRPRSHDWGQNVGGGPAPRDSLLMIQGPLLFNWRKRRRGVVPVIENGNLQGNQPPTMDRLDQWLRAGIKVPQRPDWHFVKVHTHGAPEATQRVLLGEPMKRFHEGLAQRSAKWANFHYHYLTAREMYNLVKAAESGFGGSVSEALDYELCLPANRLHANSVKI